MSYFSSIPFTIHTQLWSYLTYTTSSFTYTTLSTPTPSYFPSSVSTASVHTISSHTTFTHTISTYTTFIYTTSSFPGPASTSSRYLYTCRPMAGDQQFPYIWMQLRWRHVLSVMLGGLICAWRMVCVMVVSLRISVCKSHNSYWLTIIKQSQ